MTESGHETQAAGNDARRREHAYHRLEHIYEISQLFARFENVDQTFDKALAVAARTMRLRSAILIETEEGQTKMILWPSGSEGTEEMQAARSHAQEAYAYLIGANGTEPPMHEQAGATALPSRPEVARKSAGDFRFIVLPLAVRGRAIFGALQLEGAGPFDESDLFFVNALANQLAVALDRDFAWRRDIRRRVQAEELKRRYETLVDNLDHAFVWEADTESYRILYVSARVEALLGHSWKKLADESGSWLRLVHPDDVRMVQATFDAALAGTEDQRCDHRSVNVHGHVRWFHTRVHLARTDAGPSRLQGVSFDITPIKEAEEQLREQMHFNHAIAASIGEGVVAVDVNEQVTFVNDAAQDMLGLRGQPTVGKPFSDLTRVRAVEGPPVESPVSQAMRTGKRIRRDEHLFTRGDTLEFPVNYTAAPIRRMGHVAGAVLAFEDITERKRAEEARQFLLDASRTLGSSLNYQTAFDHLTRLSVPRLGDCCLVDVILDDGRLHRLSIAHVDPEERQAFEDISRIRSSDTPMHPVSKVLQTGRSEFVPDVDDTWMQAVASSDEQLQFMREHQIRSVMTVPLRLGDRKLGAITFTFSRAGRRHTHEDLVLAEELALRAAFALENGRLYEQARAAIGTREQILAVVAHDLRSPLSAIFLSLATLSMKGTVPVERRTAQQETVVRLKRSATRMKRLIEDLLDFASIEAGRLAIKVTQHSASAILNDAIVAFEGLAHEKQLTLTTKVAPDLPPLQCDHDRILQVLSNLVGNAVKVTPPGGSVTLRAALLGSDVVFSVTDTGPGIREQDLVHLFERYWRSGTPTYKGTGLGLAIARGIVEAHHGRIWAESVLGSGASFFFTIPAELSGGLPSAAAKSAGSRPGSDSGF